MADISNLLNKIKSAIYGREMRSALHDSIDTVNKSLEQETRNRQAADNTLQMNIDTEKGRITQEISDRITADIQLQANVNTEKGRITQEISDRQRANERFQADLDTERSRITAEIEARMLADESLDGRLSVVEQKAHVHDNYDVLNGITAERVEAWDQNNDLSDFKKYIADLISGIQEEIDSLYRAMGVSIYDGGMFESDQSGEELDGGTFDSDPENDFDCGGFEDNVIVTANSSTMDGGIY